MSGVEGRAMLLSAAVLVVLVAGTTATPRKFSQEDQYEQQPRRDRAIAADADKLQNLNGQNNPQQHRFKLPVTPDKNHHQRELQVGCAEGAIGTESNPNPEVIKNELQVHKKRQLTKDLRDTLEVVKNEIHVRQNRQLLRTLIGNSEAAMNPIRKRQKRQMPSRDRREYIAWQRNTPASTAILRQTYQLSSSQLPFWVPIWGNPRRIPIYFPAKPILFNPGYPVMNKPSNTATTEAPSDIKIVIGSRVRIPDDRPIWGVVSQDAPPASSGQTPSAQTPVERPRKPPTPPLLHRPSLGDEILTTQPSRFVPVTQMPNFAQAPQAQIQPQRPTTRRPEASRQQPVQSEGPNRCVWAIISCCSPASQQVRSNCFERLGCPGSFWDVNPCSREITAAALNAAQMFYDQS